MVRVFSISNFGLFTPTHHTHQPPMSKMRLELVDKAFAKLDKTGDGVVTIDDLKGVYNVRLHPEYLNGNKTETQLLEEFLKKFEEGTPDGKVDG